MNRFVNVDRIRTMDPATDHAAIHRITMLVEFPFDWALALQLAFYRTYAIPSISALLHRTGHIEAAPVRRAEDTGLMMAELLEHGLDHPRAKHVLRTMNRLHRQWDISDDDFRYVLGTFVFPPIRWLERYGWRPLLPQERTAAYGFYRDLADRMNIRDVPPDYDSFARWFDAYERERFALTPANTALFLASSQLLVDRFPPWAAPLARRLGTALLDEPLRRALGVPRAPLPLRVAVHLGFRARARVERWMRPRAASAFVPGGEMLSHPGGYRLEDLGTRSPTAPGRDPGL